MSDIIISGIQQIGVGVKDVYEGWKWYKKYFGFDVRVFEEAAVANYMLPYTGGEPQARHAALSLNLQGGGGFEIWQYKSRTPQPPKEEIKLGDLGIYCGKLRTHDAKAVYDYYKSENLDLLTEPMEDPRGHLHFYVRDLYGNVFDLVEDKREWFKDEGKHTSGTFGATIGCKNLEDSIKFYQEILGYEKVIYQGESTYEDLKGLPARGKKFKRAILGDQNPRVGAFARMFGHSEIELIEATEEKGKNIFEGRFWGDLGFIHLCYDIKGMESLRDKCEKAGHPFTIDSSKEQEGESFDMGEAAGYFSYIEDPSGTLIEFVETHKVPIMKKLGIFLNLKKRAVEKPLPNFVIKAMGLNRFKG